MTGTSEDLMPGAHPLRSPLSPAAVRENALTLAAAIGVDTQAATTLLRGRVALTVMTTDTNALRLATDTKRLLERTISAAVITMIDTNSAADVAATKANHDPGTITGDERSSNALDDTRVEVVFGDAAPRTLAPSVRAVVDRRTLTVGRRVATITRCTSVHPLLLRISACYVAAVTLQQFLGMHAFVHLPDPLIITFGELDITEAQLQGPLDLGHAYLAGAGAIGNGLLWAAETVDLHGELDIADDDRVGSGNLNRQVLFDEDDVGQLKAERLAARAQPANPHLVLRARPKRLQDLPERAGAWLRRLIVAVDSRRARRELQKELPGEVFDASTTDVREVVIHHHRQPTGDACMACIYKADEAERVRERHIAKQLGVTLDEVLTERVSREAAQCIIARYPMLAVDAVEGTAYDTLFKQLCGEALLATEEGERVLAPFAFVSCLAGALLLVELIRRLKGDQYSTNVSSGQTDNYWRVSPWHPPMSRARTLRPREATCEACSSIALARTNDRLWGHAVSEPTA
jgi:hypothetical protein